MFHRFYWSTTIQGQNPNNHGIGDRNQARPKVALPTCVLFRVCSPRHRKNAFRSSRNMCEGVLKLAWIETGTRYNGYVWLVYLDGGSVLIRLTNSLRLFALRKSCERVKKEVLTERAMAQARSWSYFFGFSTAARRGKDSRTHVEQCGHR